MSVVFLVLVGTMMQWFVLSPSSNLPASQGHSVWHLHALLVPVWVVSGYSGSVPQFKDKLVRSTGDSKLAVSMNTCPAVDRWLVQDITCFIQNLSVKSIACIILAYNSYIYIFLHHVTNFQSKYTWHGILTNHPNCTCKENKPLLVMTALRCPPVWRN